MNSLVTCRRCRQGQMHPIERVKLFHPPNGQEVDVRELAARCSHCTKETVLASQIGENLRRRAARKEKYGEHLLGEDIYEFRRCWGLSQQDFSKVFGAEPAAFSRYEKETDYPDLRLTRLLRSAMRDSESFKKLADTASVSLPFWETRRAAEARAAEAPQASHSIGH